MNGMLLRLHDQAVELRYPESLRQDIEILFSGHKTTQPILGCSILVRDVAPQRYSIEVDSVSQGSLNRDELLSVLSEEVARSLIVKLNTGVALHAGAVNWRGQSILVAGPSGSGKTSLVAWFINKGFEYLTDELVVLTEVTGGIIGFPRSLVVKPGSIELISSLTAFGDAHSIRTRSNLIISPRQKPPGQNGPWKCGLIIFPHYVEGAELRLDCISSALTGLKLMECNLNARNLVNGGFTAITAFARTIPAINLHYGDITHLEGVAELVAKFVLEHELHVAGARRFLSAFRAPAITPTLAPPPLTVSDDPKVASTAPVFRIPAPTSRKYPKKLTIGMATYDDYDGVYFTLQALRLYHSEILEDTEFMVVDNHPDGPCAQPLKDLENAVPNFRYLPVGDRSGTAVRSHIFEEAASDFVLCIDCHVFIVKNAVKRLIDYFGANPQTNDLLQGPLLYDDLRTIATHFHPEWRGGMYGHWEIDQAGQNPDGEPFDIPMQGMGVFACRRGVWPGFNPLFRGFGGEEGYIHEKFRRAGGRTLCLPFLRWMHRFNRPMGVPYQNTWEDRLRNYLIGFDELVLDTAALEKHFQELLGDSIVSPMIERIKLEIISERIGLERAS